MQLGRAQLTQEERLKRQLEGWCFYCGETGHLVVTCPATRSMAVSHATVYGPPSRTLTKVQVTHHTTTELEALIDSGADESLMDLAEKLGLESELLVKPIKARSFNGKDHTHISEPLQMHINDHREHIHFYLFKSSSHALILKKGWVPKTLHRL